MLRTTICIIFFLTFVSIASAAGELTQRSSIIVVGSNSQRFGHHPGHHPGHQPNPGYGHHPGHGHLPYFIKQQRLGWMEDLTSVIRKLRDGAVRRARRRLRELVRNVRNDRPSHFNRNILRQLNFALMELRKDGYYTDTHFVIQQLRNVRRTLRESLH